MKKWFFILLFLPLQLLSQTSTYRFFPDSVIWRVDGWEGWTHCTGDYFFHYYDGGDTLIGSDIYRKIHRSTMFTDLDTCVPGGSSCYFAYLGLYQGAIRDDSVLNMCYIIRPFIDTVEILFDYNQMVGDTVSSSLINGSEAVITSIDSVLINSNYHKRWNFNYLLSGSGYFIQGIGSSNGIVNWIQNGSGCYTKLICVKDGAQTLFTSGSSSPYGCETMLLGETDDKVLKVYPNPTAGIIYIDGIEGKAEYRLLNAVGRELIKGPLLNNHIDLSELNEAVYFLIIISDKGKTKNVKVIVNH